ncbi:malate dehydrogenase [Leptolyngbya sp. FACHB-261]|nr:malate dehydrogenase [Leptolyngbya sp. FACHB-261]
MHITPPQVECKTPLVAIIGSGNVGSALAQRVAEKNLADVVLLDIAAGRPQGIALDLMEARGVERHDRKITGSMDYADIAGADAVVITAGRPRTPGMSRDDLLRVNAEIVSGAARQVIAHAPDAVLIVVTNPLDVMTHLAWKASGLPAQRVIGMAGILDSARFQTFIAMELGVSSVDVSAIVLGGHGDLMVPLPRYSTVNGIPITDLMDAATIERLVERTRNGGAEIVELLQTGGAFYAPASSTYVMLESILLNRSRIVPAAAYLAGQYGLHDLFIGVPVRLSCRGVESILELVLTDQERLALQQSAQSIQKSLSQLAALTS